MLFHWLTSNLVAVDDGAVQSSDISNSSARLQEYEGAETKDDGDVGQKKLDEFVDSSITSRGVLIAHDIISWQYTQITQK